MSASDRASPNPGPWLHPHVPCGPGNPKTFTNSDTKNPLCCVLKVHTTCVCSGWWKKLWRLAVKGRQPIELIHSGRQEYEEYQEYILGRQTQYNLPGFRYFILCHLNIIYVQSNVFSGSFQKSTAQHFWRTSNWTSSWCSWRWYCFHVKLIDFLANDQI